MKKPVKNHGHSARAKLLAIAHEREIQLEYVLLRYAFERFLWRLGKSRHHDSLVLKGASAFAVWLGPFVRVTRDADMEAFGDATPERLVAAFREICAIPCPEDGVVFDDGSFVASAIRKQGGYPGIRISFRAEIGGAKLPMQIDIGFGDSIYPTAHDEDYPVLLGGEMPRIRIYPRYTIVAEKFQAMVSLDMANSRLKDFYDIWILSERFDFDGELLHTAIAKTFMRRRTSMPNMTPPALTSRFGENPAKMSQWTAFLKNAGLDDKDLPLTAVLGRIKMFLLPVVGSSEPNGMVWRAGQDWTRSYTPKSPFASAGPGARPKCPRCGWEHDPGDTICKNPACKTQF